MLREAQPHLEILCLLAPNESHESGILVCGLSESECGLESHFSFSLDVGKSLWAGRLGSRFYGRLDGWVLGSAAGWGGGF